MSGGDHPKKHHRFLAAVVIAHAASALWHDMVERRTEIAVDIMIEKAAVFFLTHAAHAKE